MIVNAVLAIALGLTPAQPGKAVQQFSYDDKVYGPWSDPSNKWWTAVERRTCAGSTG